MNTLIRGVVGSRAYGLNRPDSDYDRLAIHAIDTRRLFTIASQPAETIRTTDPDLQSHELLKAIRLMLQCNPAALEILWLDEYDEINRFGEELIDMRTDFLSRRRVRDAYLGFASSQFRKLSGHLSLGLEGDPRPKKHAVHLIRLLDQGVDLYRTGQLKLKVDNPDWVHAAAETIATSPAGTLIAQELIAQAEDDFDRIISPLPDASPTEHAEDLIQRVRKHYWK